MCYKATAIALWGLKCDFYLFSAGKQEFEMAVLADRSKFHRLPPSRIAVGRVTVAVFFQCDLECGLYLVFPQERRLAFLGFFVLVVAVPDVVPLGIGAIVPNLVAVEAAAVSANELIAERAGIAELCLMRAALSDQLLNTVENLRLDDRLMGMTYNVLLHLAAIFTNLLGQIIRRIGFLENRLALVFLVPQYSGFDTMCAVGANGCK